MHFYKKITEQLILWLWDRIESNTRELRGARGVCSKRALNKLETIAVRFILWSAVFCMISTHSSVFAFLYLVYALTRLNLTLTKCIFYRKPCITLKQI